jgi:dTDP-glucose 4,6-dehydratase
MIGSVVVAGGAGFIGSHFARLLMDRGYERVRILDKLTYAGNPDNFADLTERPGFSFVAADICNAELVREALQGFDAIVNFAAETHVDRSLLSPGSFIATDVQGVWVLLEAVKDLGLQRFVQVSTDEVYGEVMSGQVDETAPLQPRNPYSASKAGGDLLARSYFESFGLPVIITRGSNTYGPNQYPEKFLPVMITNLLLGKTIPIYGTGRQRREWLHVLDHAAGIEQVLQEGQCGEVYNIGGGVEMENLSLAHLVLEELGADTGLIEFVADRPGHDRRYAMEFRKLAELGWKPAINIHQGIRETVRWYVERREWWESIVDDPDYRSYHRKNYGQREALALQVFS